MKYARNNQELQQLFLSSEFFLLLLDALFYQIPTKYVSIQQMAQSICV